MDIIAMILLIIGGINWGSIGIFQFDIIAWAFGSQAEIISRIIYTLVGLSAIWCISLLFRDNDIVERPPPLIPSARAFLGRAEYPLPFG